MYKKKDSHNLELLQVSLDKNVFINNSMVYFKGITDVCKKNHKYQRNRNDVGIEIFLLSLGINTHT